MPALTDAASLVDWMHAEYLSALLLRKAAPKPSTLAKAKPPKNGVVTMEWGLVLPDQESKLASYLVRAEGVTSWTLDGEWDKHDELEIRSITDRDGAIAFDMRAPGRLSLVCERVSIEAGPIRRYAPPAGPDDTCLLIWGPREVTWNELWQWLAPALGLELYRQREGGDVLMPADERERVIVGPYHHMFRVQQASFWQERGWAAGFREFAPGSMPEWTFEIDAGPVADGFGLSANAFGIAAARRNGRFDHADHVARRHGACGVFRGHAAGAFAIALRIVRARLPRRRA